MAIAGKLGSIKIGSSLIANIANWKLDENCDTDETTNFGSAGHKEYLATLDSWSITFDGNWDILTDTNGQGAVTKGSTGVFKLYVDSTHYYTGSAIITKISSSADVGKKITVSFAAQGTGALTPVA
jgi:predicted secreted protein